ncbi:alpha/beta fold hydrolase [Ferrovibrio sp.]|uniref:alpha/beta hydrolase n=1 Tax=Ferrovibrio sp. TaxID=1917215 RepID=UPI00262B8E75|nr:alpha/beta fold hydrolase [Ferrovibrio sp.]
MSQKHLAKTKNSTNIRTIISFLAIRSLIRAGFVVTPGWAARRAATLFLASQRRPAGPRPQPASHATPFAVDGPVGPVAAWSYGRTGDPAVLLVHGWEDDHLSWAPLVDRLVAKSYRVLSLDLPGHGRSPARSRHGRATPIPVLAAAIAAVAREAVAIGALPENGKFEAVIAHSLGGTATLIAATEMGLAADRFAILAAPNHPRLFASALMQMLKLTRAQVEQVYAAIEQIIGRSMDSLYLPPKLRDLDAAGLILHSRDDRTVPLKHSQENAAGWPRAEFRILDGLGHRKLVSDNDVQAMLLHFVKSEAPADAYGLRPDAA